MKVKTGQIKWRDWWFCIWRTKEKTDTWKRRY